MNPPVHVPFTGTGDPLESVIISNFLIDFKNLTTMKESIHGKRNENN